MLKILINAYACSPGMGSEPGMAWNWCVNLAKHCELHIITEGEFRDKIEEIVPTLPQRGNMHFYYNPIGDNEMLCAKIRKMCWNQGDWRFYKYYQQWQWKTYLKAKEICTEQHIDVLHQLNMIGFREPGFLWKLSKETNVPFVWGPTDAKDKFPMAYTEGAGLKTKLFLLLKNTITCWQLKHSKRVRMAAETAKIVISASSNSVRSFKKYMNIESPLLNESGCLIDEISVSKPIDKKTFDFLWVGKMDFRKQLGLALRAVAAVYRHDIRLHIVGGGDNTKYRTMAQSLGIMDLCVWHGAVSHEEVQRIMQQSNLFFFTSVAEGTPHAVLEAIANHLPILCFDTCGQGDAVTETVGRKIPLSNPNQSVKDFAKMIEYLYSHRDVLKSMSDSCKERSVELSWDNKARQMTGIYEKVISNRSL